MRNFYLILLFFIVSCAGSTSSFDKMPKNPIIMEDGFGKNIEDAKSNALSNLSKRLIVQVKSQDSYILQVVSSGYSNKKMAENISSTAVQSVQTLSNVDLKGVRYVNPRTSGGNIVITAVLGEDDYINTVEYLYAGMDIEKIDSLTKSQQQEEKVKVNSLIVLLTVPEANGVIKNRDTLLTNAVTYNNELSKRLGNLGWVLFTGESKFSDALVDINGVKYPPYKRIFLSPGKYSYSISKDDYHIQRGEVEIRSGFEVNLPINLMLNIGKPVSVNVLVNGSNINNVAIKNILRASIAPYQMEFDIDALHSLVLDVERQSSEAYGIKTNKVVLVLTGNSGSYRYSKTIDFVSLDNNGEISLASLKPMIEKIVLDFAMDERFISWAR